MSPLSCPACHCALRVSGIKAGCRIRCPRCGEIFAPAPSDEAPEPSERGTEPAPAPPPAAPAITDDEIFAKIAEADDPVAAAAEVRKPPIPAGEAGNPLSLGDDEPPPARPTTSPRPAPTSKGAKRAQKRRTEEWDADETRSAPAINPIWLLGGLGVLVVGMLALGMFVLSRQFDAHAEQAAAAAQRERDAATRREREVALAKPQPKPVPNNNPVQPDPNKPDPVEPEPVKPEPMNPMEVDPAPVFPPGAPVPPMMGQGFPQNFGQPAFPQGFGRPGGGRPFRQPVNPQFNQPMQAQPQVAEPRPDVIRPAAHPAKITPTKADDETEIKLPGTADLTCFGGGGRFVLLRIPSAKKVAVLDVCEGKITRYLPLAEPGALIAAGNEYLFVMAPTDNVIQRWNLTTFEKERTVANPLNGPVRHLLVGHATDGPLFAVGPNKALDTKTFQEVALGDAANGGRGSVMWNDDQHPTCVNVSADGRVLAWHRQGLTPAGLSTMVLGATETKSYYQHVTVGVILPGPDGTLFTSSGMFTPELRSIGQRSPYQPGHHAPVPAAHGKFYLAVTPGDPAAEKPAARVSLRMIGENKPLGDLSDLAGLDVPREYNQGLAKGLQLHNRVFLVPDAKALAVLHGSADRVTIHAFDAEAVMTKSGFDFLFVTSRPTRAVCGETFTYKPEVKSRRGGVRVRLDAGPERMKVAADGTLTWAVPPNFADISVSVALTISDNSGQQTVHTFNLPVSSRP